jgi:alpha-ketoglutarate-dependent taurine dioxygenase
MLPIGDEVLYSLVSYKGETPTAEQRQKFSEIFNWIDDYVKNNDDNRIVHKWQQGDLLFSDIFKLMHAVTGGFNPEDREFIGIWGYANSDIGR